MKFGDKIYVNGVEGSVIFKRVVGTIIHYLPEGRLGVEFDHDARQKVNISTGRPVAMHSADGHGLSGHCYYVDLSICTMFERPRSGFGKFLDAHKL